MINGSLLCEGAISLGMSFLNMGHFGSKINFDWSGKEEPSKDIQDNQTGLKKRKKLRYKNLISRHFPTFPDIYPDISRHFPTFPVAREISGCVGKCRGPLWGGTYTILYSIP